ncbi:MAG: hypothetical protein JWO13_3386 [Acidobacteriales bacterium]|nr:hypothetical protein [Terriglobales bacterium]
MPLQQKAPSFLGGIAAKALLGGLLFLIIGIGGDYIATRFGLERDLLFVNDFVAAAFVVIVIAKYEQRRRNRIRDRLAVIELMNHHVRNALQVIALSPHAQLREENVEQIQQAIARIEWALREILPGELSEEVTKSAAADLAPRVHAPLHH